jgi:hypothetical protein
MTWIWIGVLLAALVAYGIFRWWRRGHPRKQPPAPQLLRRTEPAIAEEHDHEHKAQAARQDREEEAAAPPVSGVPRSAARQQFEARAAGIGRLGAHLVDDLLPRLRRLGTLDRQRRSRCNSQRAVLARCVDLGHHLGTGLALLKCSGW